MTVVMEPTQSPMAMQDELAVNLEQLLHGYLALLGSEHPQWSQDETELVRRTRDLLVRTGHAPQLTYDVLNHIDSPYANKPLVAQTL